MKLLYISVHEPLQYDEVSLFLELGAEVHVGKKKGTRPGANRMRPDLGHRTAWDEETLGNYDAVIVMHDWACFQRIYAARAPGQRIIWRTIGQSNPRHEQNMKVSCPGAEIVRYSPAERKTAIFAGETVLIRFYKDETEHSGWIGGDGVQMLASRFGRRNLPDHDVLSQVLAPFDWSLYGNNKGHPNSKGFLDGKEIIPMMRRSDLFVSAHSVPASYTLNLIEAMIVGAPVVSVGREVVARNADIIQDAPGHALDMFEVDEILEHGKCGILVDDPAQATSQIQAVLGSRNAAEELSQAGRARAIDLFGKSKIKEQWRAFLGL